MSIASSIAREFGGDSVIRREEGKKKEILIYTTTWKNLKNTVY